jgi:hypothetical protein
MELSTKYNELSIDGWIYLNDEIILKHLTNQKSRSSLTNFYKRNLLHTNNIEGTDYRKIKKTNEMVKKYELSGLANDKVKNNIIQNTKLYYAVTLIFLNKLLLQIHHKKPKFITRIQECEVSDKLSKLILGKREITIPNTTGIRVDILTDSHIVEVKRFKSRMSAIGQVLYYGHYYPDKLLRIHLFDCDSTRDVIFEKICSNVNIEVTYED